MLRLVLIIVFFLAVAVHGGTVALTSPDGAVQCEFSIDAEGHLVYWVTQGGYQRLETARAGVIIDGVDVGSKVTLGEPRTRSVSEVFPWRGNKTRATNFCRASEIPIRLQGGMDWTLEARLFNEGVGFRYRVPG